MPILITSKRHNFRRCNMAHPGEPTEYADDKFSAEELEILQAEPMLLVEVREGKSKKAEDKVIGQVGGKQEGPQAEIIKAIGTLETGNDELWTNDGKPQVAAIEKVLERNISAKDRDAAWAEMNKVDA